MNQVLALVLALSLMFTGLTVTGLTGEALPPVQEETVREAAPAETEAIAAAPAVQPAEIAERAVLMIGDLIQRRDVESI